ncbi:MAG: acyl-CoA thioesterase [Chloroflexi bacterium]|nr:acyl-CoA thioesterase [Chloroflexota bacterium]
MTIEKSKFFTQLRVRFAETDLQGHVFFGNYLIYFDEALTQYQHAIGVTFQDLLNAGVDMFYIRSECEYKSRAFFEDVLNVHARVGSIGNSSITFEFAAIKAHNDELVATGKIVAVIIDPQTKKPTRVPEAFRDAIAKYENQNS